MHEEQKISSHLYFDQQWDELPGYAGYVPEEFSWVELKERFNRSTYGPLRPLPTTIKKEGTVCMVYLYGFSPSQNIAFCEVQHTKQHIAIVW